MFQFYGLHCRAFQGGSLGTQEPNHRNSKELAQCVSNILEASEDSIGVHIDYAARSAAVPWERRASVTGGPCNGLPVHSWGPSLFCSLLYGKGMAARMPVCWICALEGFLICMAVPASSVEDVSVVETTYFPSVKDSRGQGFVLPKNFKEP